jgi:hypothetical protein
MLKAKDGDFFISDWLRNRNTLEYLSIWEKINNQDFNYGEFAIIKNKSGLNSFRISVKQWIERTKSIGLMAKTGRYGGTYAHKDIAFEFGMWISPEFKVYLIKEFQRLKSNEQQQLQQEWNVKRFLVRANYKVHTDSVKQNLIPREVSKKQARLIYASEADVLNVSMFGITAKEWREGNPNLKGTIRDYADITQLVCLAGLESLNAEFIRQGVLQSKRLKKLNKIAIIQMKSLVGVKTLKESNSTPLEIK